MLSTIVVAGVAVWALLWYAMPQYYFRFYPLIPAYFLALGIVVAMIMRMHHHRLGAHKIVNLYMAIRLVKLFLTLALVGIYYVTVGEQMEEFGLTLATFYFIHLFVETYLFYRFEKLKKQIG
jgi:hypothetical protein